MATPPRWAWASWLSRRWGREEVLWHTSALDGCLASSLLTSATFSWALIRPPQYKEGRPAHTCCVFLVSKWRSDCHRPCARFLIVRSRHGHMLRSHSRTCIQARMSLIWIYKVMMTWRKWNCEVSYFGRWYNRLARYKPESTPRIFVIATDQFQSTQTVHDDQKHCLALVSLPTVFFLAHVHVRRQCDDWPTMHLEALAQVNKRQRHRFLFHCGKWTHCGNNMIQYWFFHQFFQAWTMFRSSEKLIKSWWARIWGIFHHFWWGKFCVWLNTNGFSKLFPTVYITHDVFTYSQQDSVRASIIRYQDH